MAMPVAIIGNSFQVRLTHIGAATLAGAQQRRSNGPPTAHSASQLRSATAAAHHG